MADEALKPSASKVSTDWTLSEDLFWGLVALWLAPVALAWVNLSGRPDELAGTLAVAAGAAWAMWHAGRAMPPQTGARRLCVIALGWGFILWKLAHTWPADFWLVRIILPVSGAALAFLWWGLRGVGRSWRAPVALLLWVGLPSFVWLNRLDAGGTVSRATAVAADFLLWHLGAEPVRHGSTLQLPQGAVEVLTGCTGLPLAGALWRLLIPLVVALRIRWWRALLLAALVVPLSFGIAVGRVMLMARVVDDLPRFHYWHDAPGSSWFTAVAIVTLAAGVYWAMQRPAAAATSPVRMPRRLVVATAGLACLGLALVWGRDAEPGLMPPVAEAAVVSGWQAQPVALTGSEGWANLAVRDADHPLLWVREFAYESAGQKVRVWVGYAPCWLDGDPVGLSRHYAPADATPAPENWNLRQLDVGGSVCEQLTAGRRVWLAALSPDGRVSGTMAEWVAATTAWPRDAARWGAWLAGTAPLRDKRGFWLRLEMAGNSPTTVLALAPVLRAWQKQVRDFPTTPSP